jgi:hypothetical protein
MYAIAMTRVLSVLINICTYSIQYCVYELIVVIATSDYSYRLLARYANSSCIILACA